MVNAVFAASVQTRTCRSWFPLWNKGGAALAALDSQSKLAGFRCNVAKGRLTSALLRCLLSAVRLFVRLFCSVFFPWRHTRVPDSWDCDTSPKGLLKWLKCHIAFPLQHRPPNSHQSPAANPTQPLRLLSAATQSLTCSAGVAGEGLHFNLEGGHLLFLKSQQCCAALRERPLSSPHISPLRRPPLSFFKGLFFVFCGRSKRPPPEPPPLRRSMGFVRLPRLNLVCC